MADGWALEVKEATIPAGGQVSVTGEDGVTLTWSVTRLDDAVLELAYEVENGSSETILLCTPLVEMKGGAAVPDPGKVYRYLDPDGVLHLTKRFWPVPVDVDVYAPEMPCFTAVEPRGRFSERVVAQIPTRISYPYRFTAHETTLQLERVCEMCSGVALSLGYVHDARTVLSAAAAGWAHHRNGATLQGVSLATFAASQRVLVMDPVDVQVLVQDAE